MEVRVKLDMFEGPLDLLLHLIETAEVDIYQVPIAKITDQYLEVLNEAKQMQLEVASEFLVMAATLLAIKSRMLLPKQELLEDDFLAEEERWFEDPRTELVERLLEYKKYKRLGEVLRLREEERSKVYSRQAIDLTPFAPEENPVEGLSPDDLLQVFVEALKNRKPKEQITRLAREEISVSDRMEEICTLLSSKGKLFFSRLIDWNTATRESVITTFLALLELIKLKKIVCYQEGLFGEIRVEVLPG